MFNPYHMERLLKLRQAVDNHLMNVLRIFKDIKQPPVNVVVKQAEHVNVAEQLNQADKQVNISGDQRRLNH